MAPASEPLGVALEGERFDGQRLTQARLVEYFDQAIAAQISAKELSKLEYIILDECDRALPADFERFMGDMARIEMRIPVEGRRRFKGRLMGLTDAGEIRIQTEEGDYVLPLTSMDKAKLLGLEETSTNGAERRRKH